MNRTTFNVEFVTPCFLDGAQGSTEWRPASIRGQLRWWFRAVAGGAWRGDLERVRQEEARIFGSTDRRSPLRIAAPPGPLPIRGDFGRKFTAVELAKLCKDSSAESRLKILNERGQEEGTNPVHYLGFGPVAGGRIDRSYLASGSKTKFDLQWEAELPEKVRPVFEQALWAWLNLGGIGAKSRKGFGSVRCESNDRYCDPADRKTFTEGVSRLLGPARELKHQPFWTHLSSGSRVFLATEGFGSWQDAMASLGAWLIGFRRRYGYPNDSREIAGTRLANRDYEWAAPKGRHPCQGAPDRAGFGLPIPFRRKVNGEPRGETVIWGLKSQGKPEEREKEADARRASPLLLHVSRLGGAFVPVLTYVPAAFLPAAGRLKFKHRRTDPLALTEMQRDIVSHFLNGLQSKGLITEVAP